MLTNLFNPIFKCITILNTKKLATKETVRFIRMSYNEYKPSKCNSNKSPVIIMHCIMGTKMNWHNFGTKLSLETKRTVYCVDARNHGQSPFTKEHSSKHLAMDVEEFVKHKCLSKVSLMGHGMGGRGMMFFALKYPSFVERVIIVDISPVAIPQDYLSLEQVFLVMKGVEIPKTHTLAEGRQMIAEVFAKLLHVEENAKFLSMNLHKNWQGDFYWGINIDALRDNLREFSEFMNHLDSSIKPFQGPVVFICGRDSNFVDFDSISTIRTLFPKSELHWLDAGHLVQMKQPKQFMDLIIQFLNK